MAEGKIPEVDAMMIDDDSESARGLRPQGSTLGSVRVQ
jgi:hypothetical protein